MCMEQEWIEVVKSYKNIQINKLPSDCYAGIDEVGVSSIAGSLVCSVVILPREHTIPRLPIDSKLLQDTSITELAKEVQKQAIYYAILAVAPSNVDEKVQKIGMLALQKELWKRAIDMVREVFPSVPVVLDGKHSVEGYTEIEAIIGADNQYSNVSASAILSKYFCDEDLRDIGKDYPGYLFEKHKGYPTEEHLTAIRLYGLSPFHRAYMTDTALNKKEDTRIYSLEELDIALRKAGACLKENTKLANEGTLSFLREMWVKVIQKKQLPSEKQQRFTMNVCKQVMKNYKRSNQTAS